MSDQTILFALLAVVLALLIWGRWRYDFVAFGALLAALLIGVVPAEKAFDGFVHPATVIIALVLIVSRGMTNAGVVDHLGRLLNATPRSLPQHIGLTSVIAAPLGVSPDPFLMAVAISASCAFLTPIGHKNNILVLGPGGYRFGDYWRIGLPLEIIILVVSVPLLLIVWPL